MTWHDWRELLTIGFFTAVFILGIVMTDMSVRQRKPVGVFVGFVAMMGAWMMIAAMFINRLAELYGW